MSTSPDGIATLAFAPGPHPFALTEHDAAKDLSGDQWAWRFLRLSPAYRYDFALWVARPAWLKRHENKSLVALKSELPQAEWETVLTSDSRYFTLGGRPLGRDVEWPEIEAQTLQEFLSTNAKVRGNITVRELDAPRLYGVGHWFDPKLVDLPPLPSTGGLRSWFYSLIEPIWESPLHALLPNPDCWVNVGEHRVCVGMEPDIGVRLGEKMTHFERRPVAAGDGTTTTKLVQVAEPAPKTGFEYDSELAVLLSLDGNVSAQMRAISQLLHSAARSMGQIKSGPACVLATEPIIFPATNPRIERFAGLFGSLRDLTAADFIGRRHWYVVLFDIRAGVQSQLDMATALLKKRQLFLSESGELTSPARHRAGTKSAETFWLKAALCCLETQLSLLKRYPGESFGRRKITEAILSPSNPRHQQIRGTNAATMEPTKDDLEADTVRDALDVGKTLALGQYAYLIGATAAELMPQRPSRPQPVRRYTQGKLTGGKATRRKPSKSA